MRIALVIGHRKGSQGAYGNMGISEFEFWDEFINDYWYYFPHDKHEFKVFYRDNLLTWYGEKMRNLHKHIDEWGADLSISFHFNGSSNPSVNGHEVLYSSKGGKKYARLMDKEFDKYLSNSDRGIKHRTKKQRGGGFLARGKSKCILIEPFFGYEQDEYVRNGQKREDLINAIIAFINRIKDNK